MTANSISREWKRSRRRLLHERVPKMSMHILKCQGCEAYALKGKCPKCGAKAVSPIPAKYSPEDPYGKYRREAKKEMLKEKGLL